MKKKGPYEVISIQTCMDWCNKFETCSFFSFEKIKKLCFLFEVRYSRPHGNSPHGDPKEQTSGPKFCNKMKVMENPVQNNTSKSLKNEHFYNSNVHSLILVSFKRPFGQSTKI